MPAAPEPLNSPPPKARLIFGGSIFFLGLFCPLFIPLVSKLGLPEGWQTALSGLLFFGIPELLKLTAVAVLGKPGFNYFKAKIFGFLKQYAPPDEVSLTRYRIGLALFVLPLLLAWMGPYLTYFLADIGINRLVVNIGGDIMLLISLFVLGGDFWDKVRALFVHGAKAVMPQPNS